MLKQRKFRVLAFFLCLTLLMGVVPVQAAEDTQEPYGEQEIVRAIVVLDGAGAAEAVTAENGTTTRNRQLASAQEAVSESHDVIQPQLEAAAPSMEVVEEYTVLLSGLAVDIEYGEIEALEAQEGVAGVFVVTTYEAPQLTESSSETLSAASLSASGSSTGQGTLIAVLDTGVNLSHEAFTVYEDVLGDTSLSASSRQLGETSVAGTYVSEKIPFAYDYGDNDGDVTDKNGHGTHVAGIAAGYAQDEDGGVTFSGAAPGAQLAIMKIFGDNATTATTDVYFKALEDAYTLGADVINLSLGTACGFVHDEKLETATFGDIYKTLEDAGIMVCAAAGNHGSQADYNSVSAGSVLASYADYGTVSSPSSYTGNTSVAAATALTTRSYVLELGDSVLAYSTAKGQETALADAYGGQGLPFVTVEGTGEAADFAAADVTGKIAVASRGTLSFAEKAENAAAAGAIALVIYNNTTDTVTMRLSDPEIPVVLVSQDSGALLTEAGSGTLLISAEQQDVASSAAQDICSFSAWGTTPNLTIAPALSGVGENVSSASWSSDTGYRRSSGTSMASPAVAGAYACVLSALKEQLPDADKVTLMEMAEARLLSTAEILGDEDDPISVRQQGAGVADADAALDAAAYLTEPLQELGDDPEESGVCTMTLTLQNAQEPECPSARFTDVSEDQWFHEYVDYTASEGLFIGVSDTSFAPDSCLTRGQMVMVLYRIAGEPEAQLSSFSDVPETSYYAEAIGWAQACGVVNGMTRTEFCPDDPITREQLVTILYRYYGSPAVSGSLTDYQDAGSVSDYAKSAMTWAVSVGVINSYSTASLQLAPQNTATRAQTAAILTRYYGGNPVIAEYTPDSLVMGDETTVDADGLVRNLLSSITLDSQVEFSFGDSLTLHRWTHSVTFTVTVTLSQAEKTRLSETFENGGYVEGYVILADGDQSVHATFLAFFGDWSEGEILETVDFRDVLDAEYQISQDGSSLVYSDLLPLNTSANLAQIYCSQKGSDYYGKAVSYLGGNAYTAVSYLEDRCLIPTTSGDRDDVLGQQLWIRTVQLRNAETLTLEITDKATGEVYYRDQRSYRNKSSYSTSKARWTYNSFSWSGTDLLGNVLSNGTELVVSVYAALPGEDARLEWQFSCTVDSVAPSVDYSLRDGTLTVTAQDAEYLSAVTVTDSDGNTVIQETYADETAGASHSLTVDVSALTGSLTISAVDYATNMRVKTVSLD